MAAQRRHLILAVAVAATLVLSSCWYDLGGLDAVPPSQARADAQPDVEADAGPEAAPNPCPQGRGPRMVDVGPFCIDSTEVTQRDYGEFLADKGSDLSGQPAVCSWNQDYNPSSGVATGAAYPAVGIDWCDAVAYCTWAGKRLCGKIGGGSLSLIAATLDDPAIDQWYFACSKGGERSYPYGTSYDKTACVGELQASIADVATNTRCEGGFAGIFDLSGNVWEWEDACDDAGKCANRGGAVAAPTDTTLGCGYEAVSYNRNRADRPGDTGFRCCSR